jgi:hypothetical protein
MPMLKKVNLLEPIRHRAAAAREEAKELLGELMADIESDSPKVVAKLYRLEILFSAIVKYDNAVHRILSHD